MGCYGLRKVPRGGGREGGRGRGRGVVGWDVVGLIGIWIDIDIDMNIDMGPGVRELRAWIGYLL